MPIASSSKTVNPTHPAANPPAAPNSEVQPSKSARFQPRPTHGPPSQHIRAKQPSRIPSVKCGRRPLPPSHPQPTIRKSKPESRRQSTGVTILASPSKSTWIKPQSECELVWRKAKDHAIKKPMSCLSRKIKLDNGATERNRRAMTGGGSTAITVR